MQHRWRRHATSSPAAEWRNCPI